MTPIDEYLEKIAHQTDVRIEYGLATHGRDGEYVHGFKLIVLRSGMHARLHRCVLAHELAHAAFGHLPVRLGPTHAKQERMAEEWAALRLIRPADYRRAEEAHSGHAGAMALDLGVMKSIVLAFQDVLARTGTRTDWTTNGTPLHGAPTMSLGIATHDEGFSVGRGDWGSYCPPTTPKSSSGADQRRGRQLPNVS